MIIRPNGPLEPHLLLYYDPPEADFRRDIYVNATRAYGWKVYATYDARRSPPGEADLRMYRPPRAIHAELKRNDPKSKPSDEQLFYGDLMRACGIEYHLWRPRDWNTICEALR